jgi:hypothetical protein
MRLQFFHKAGIVACAAAAAATHLAFSAREELHKKNRPKVPASSYSAIEGRRQAAEIDGLLKGLKGKSTRQKIEDAYTAATKTHDYGFPQSISRPSGSAKDSERERW